MLSLLAAISALLVQPRDPGQFPRAMLAFHNAARATQDLPPLSWDEGLAREAQAYAEVLARSGRFEHSHFPGEGENLWMGTQLAFSYQQMVGSWADEREFYRNGVFPDVSLTGRWQDVGHYSQMMWRTTTSVGCGLASEHHQDVLVCRYTPQGNWIGRRAY